MSSGIVEVAGIGDRQPRDDQAFRLKRGKRGSEEGFFARVAVQMEILMPRPHHVSVRVCSRPDATTRARANRQQSAPDRADPLS